MAGTAEVRSEPETSPASNCRFEWDEDSKLYFHASSGFYHDPNAGWYYSSRDGLYYTFEDGSYVLLTCNKDKAYECASSVSGEPIQDRQYLAEDITGDGTESHCPPSEWLEDTLIDLYLSGYSNSEIDAACSTGTLQTDGERIQVPGEILPDHLASDKSLGCYYDITCHHVEVNERIAEVMQDVLVSSQQFTEEDFSFDEKNWHAQYGQVVRPEDKGLPSFPVIDLWDWEMVVETGRKNNLVARLIGRLVKRSSKLHPSVPSGGGLLKTAPIHGVHLDLVRVVSGKVYRLRSPDTKYLASLSAYDASNPTKDWKFPDLYVGMPSMPVNPNQTCGDVSNAVINDDSSANIDQVPSTFEKDKPVYRDRASERRILHGGFGIGPGQKDSIDDNNEAGSSHSFDLEAAAAEALNMSFGSGSYGRRIIERMGWKDGDSLGRTNSGILEPLQAVGNKGQAGLGWNRV